MNQKSPNIPFSQADQILDARGLLCPEPLLRAKSILAGMTAGQQLHVIATDPHAPLDFEVFTLRTRHNLEAFIQDNGEYHIFVCKQD